MPAWRPAFGGSALDGLHLAQLRWTNSRGRTFRLPLGDGGEGFLATTATEISELEKAAAKRVVQLERATVSHLPQRHAETSSADAADAPVRGVTTAAAKLEGRDAAIGVEGAMLAAHSAAKWRSQARRSKQAPPAEREPKSSERLPADMDEPTRSEVAPSASPEPTSTGTRNSRSGITEKGKRILRTAGGVVMTPFASAFGSHETEEARRTVGSCRPRGSFGQPT